MTYLCKRSNVLISILAIPYEIIDNMMKAPVRRMFKRLEDTKRHKEEQQRQQQRQQKQDQEHAHALKEIAPSVLSSLVPDIKARQKDFIAIGTALDVLSLLEKSKWNGDIYDQPYADTYHARKLIPPDSSRVAFVVDHDHRFVGPQGRSGLAFVLDWLIVTRLTDTTYGWRREETFLADN